MFFAYYTNGLRNGGVISYLCSLFFCKFQQISTGLYTILSVRRKRQSSGCPNSLFHFVYHCCVFRGKCACKFCSEVIMDCSTGCWRNSVSLQAIFVKLGNNVATYRVHKVAEVECTLLHSEKRFLPLCTNVREARHASNKSLSVFEQSL